MFLANLKSFHIDGRFDVIATGSLWGVHGYGKGGKKREKEEARILLLSGMRP